MSITLTRPHASLLGAPLSSSPGPRARAVSALFLGLSVLAPLGCGDDAASQDGAVTSRMSATGRVTALCGYAAPLPGGFVGQSPAGPCEGVCSSSGPGGACQDPWDSGSRVDVYGCAGKTSTSGFSCDGDHNGGVLLASYNDGQVHGIAQLAAAFDSCTIQIDVLRPGSQNAVGLRDFLVWERDDCSPDPNPCACDGGVDHLGNPVSSTTCGEQVCGADFQYYTCEPSGWTAQGGVCPGDSPCQCAGGVDHLGNPITSTTCGEQVCGADLQFYTCEESGWVAQGDACPVSACTCTDGVDNLGNPVSSTTCGEQICGADLQFYTCEQSGWVAQGSACGDDTGGDTDGDLVFDTPAELQSALASGVDVRGATINFVFALDITMKDFRDVHFAGGVDGGWFFGTELDGATFSGAVRHAPFLYADLDGADFGGATLEKCDFAFTQNADAAIWPPAAAIVHTVFTGAGSRSAPMLPHTRLDELASAATLDVLLADAVVEDGMLGSSWRSYLYDSYLACVGGGGDKYFALKSFIFDAVDGRYSGETYISPPGGPTLAFMHAIDHEGDGAKEFAGWIDAAIADLIASDEPAFLDDPFIGRVSWSNERATLDALADQYLDAEAWYAALPGHAVQWNTPTASRNAAEVALAPDTIAAVTAALGGAAKDQFVAVSADRLVSMEDLAALPARATIVAGIHAVYRARAPGDPLDCPFP